MEFLSGEWLDSFGEALGALPGADTVELVVQYEVDESIHHICLGPTNAVVAGSHPSPDVIFSTDTATAAAIGRGELSAQAAFMRGDLRVRGRVTELLAGLDLYERFDEATATVRHATNP